MKKLILVTLLIFLSGVLNAQENAVVNKLAENYKLDFAISDAPAFKILGKEPSNLLRPSSSDVVSFIVSNLLSPSDLSMPGSYAAEVSPALLVKKNLTLSDFRKNYILYNMRLSFGTTKDYKSGKYNIGIGLRSTIIDKSDLRNDENYLDELFGLLDDAEKYKKEIGDEFWRICDCSNKDSIAQEKKKKYMEAELKKYDQGNNKLFDELLEKYQNKNWNKQKWDLAFAVLGGSKDSLVNNVEFMKCSFWTTFSCPLRSWGQVLFGVNFDYNALSEKGSGSLASRVYAGSNSFKGFVEGQFKTDNNEKSNNWLINIGAELKILNNIWVNYVAGYGVNIINSERKSAFNSHFDVRFALK